jgi:hypothetical protein
LKGYTITDRDVILVTDDGQSFSVPRHSVNGGKLAQGIREGLADAQLIELADPTRYINAIGGGVVTVKSGTVKYNDEAMPECLVRRLMDMLSNDLPIQHLVNFYDRLAQNPSRRAVQELYTFLEHKNIPISPDGTLLMYKAITNGWMDKYTGTISNRIDAVPTMPRNGVCDDADRGCSKGYHAGSLEYVESFARNFGTEGGDRIVLVEVDPADIVSIPKDCSCQKVRTCKYRVLTEYRGKLPDGGVRNVDDPYMDDFGDDYTYGECEWCESPLDSWGDCTCGNCPGDPDAEIVLTRLELDTLLEEAADRG